jgi:hypothetical protein
MHTCNADEHEDEAFQESTRQRLLIRDPRAHALVGRISSAATVQHNIRHQRCIRGACRDAAAAAEHRNVRAVADVLYGGWLNSAGSMVEYDM